MTGSFLRLDQINPSLFDSLIRRSRTGRPPEEVSSTLPISGLMAPDTDFAQVSINEEGGPVSTSDNILTRAATALGAFSTDPDRVADAIIPRQENPPQIDLGEWETMRPLEETLDLSRAAAIDATLQSMNRDAAGISESLYPSVTDADPFEPYYRSDVGPTRTTASYSYNNTPLVEGGLRGNSRRGGDAPKEVQREVMQRIIDVGRSAGMSDEDVALTLAIASHESGFNPDAATGSSSASGLGQFINDTAASYGITDANRWDVDAQVRALVGLTQDNIAEVNRTNRSRDYVYALHHDGPSLNYGGLDIGRENVNPLVPGFLELVRSVPRRDDYGPNQAASELDKEASGLAVQSSLVPQPAPAELRLQFEEAKTPQEVTQATVDVVTASLPEQEAVQLLQNPLQYALDNYVIGLNEDTALGQEAIEGYFRTATPNGLDALARNQAGGISSTRNAWCAVQLDAILRGIGAPPLDPTTAPRGSSSTRDRPYAAMRAAEYANYGEPVEMSDMRAGDIIVMSRSGGGHIGIYTGTTDAEGRPYILGGNQASVISGSRGVETNVSATDPSKIEHVRRVPNIETASPETIRQLSEMVVYPVSGPALTERVKTIQRAVGLTGTDVDGVIGQQTTVAMRDWLDGNDISYPENATTDQLAHAVLRNIQTNTPGEITSLGN